MKMKRHFTGWVGGKEYALKPGDSVPDELKKYLLETHPSFIENVKEKTTPKTKKK